MGEMARVARCYSCSFFNSATSIYGPKSQLVIWHNFTCTSSNIIYYISCSKCCILNIGECDVDKSVWRHFNAANQSISDIKVCAISAISAGNDRCKRHEKRLIVKMEAFIRTGSTNDFLLLDPVIASAFVQHVRTNAVNFHSIVYVHPPPPIYSPRTFPSFTALL